MVAQEEAHVEVDPAAIGTFELAGSELPYVDLEEAPAIHTRLRVDDVEYVYQRSFPLKGHSAVMPAAIAELQAKGRPILIVERDERYLVYTA
jgi:hypothetical protein